MLLEDDYPLYDKLVIRYPFLIPPKKNMKEEKEEKSSQTGFQPFVYNQKLFTSFDANFVKMKISFQNDLGKFEKVFHNFRIPVS